MARPRQRMIRSDHHTDHSKQRTLSVLCCILGYRFWHSHGSASSTSSFLYVQSGRRIFPVLTDTHCSRRTQWRCTSSFCTYRTQQPDTLSAPSGGSASVRTEGQHLDSATTPDCINCLLSPADCTHRGRHSGLYVQNTLQPERAAARYYRDSRSPHRDI